MKAVVLAGGLGKRMMPLTESVPKVLIKIGGKPFLYWTMRNAQQAGINEFVIVGCYKIEHIRDFIKEFGFKAEVVDQGEPLGTAHAVGVVESSVKENFLVINGDDLFSPRDIKGVAKADKFCYVGGIEHEHPELYGVLVMKGGMLNHIAEKPKSWKTNMINAGIYKFTPEIFNAIKKVGPSPRGELELTDAISFLCKEKKVKVYKIKDYRMSLGKPEDIPALEEFVKSLNSK